MPLKEIPTFFHPEVRSLIDSALEQAWLELREENPYDEVMARRKLATTIVALAAIGETDVVKLKKFALHAARTTKPVKTSRVRKIIQRREVAASA